MLTKLFRRDEGIEPANKRKGSVLVIKPLLELGWVWINISIAQELMYKLIV